MNKTKRIIGMCIFLLLVLFSLPIVKTSLSCEVTQSCSYTDIFHISNETNAHAELNNNSNYNYIVCCQETTGINLGSGNSNYYYTLLKLHNETNAHVELNNESNYNFDVFINVSEGILTCGYETDCSGYDTCIASVSGSTNAHSANCTYYDLKLCCKVTNTAPSNLDVDVNKSRPLNSELGALNISWTDNSGGVWGTQIWRNTTDTSFVNVGNASAGTSSYSDNDLDDNTLYYYKVRAYNDTSTSQWSPVTYNITADRTGPDSPELTATADNPNNRMNLTWAQGDEGLILYMPFEEGSGTTAEDWSLNKYDGIIAGSPSRVSGKSGNGNAIDFADTQITQYINLSYSVLNGLTDFTISFWAYGGGSGEYIISGSNGSDHNHMLMHGPTDTGWHYYVWRRGGGYGTHIYKDLIQDDSLIHTNPGNPINIAPGGLIIAQEQDSLGGGFAADQAFSGMIDEFKIYNREISNKEMADDMQSGLIRHGLYRSNTSSGTYGPVDGVYDDFSSDTSSQYNEGAGAGQSSSLTTWSFSNNLLTASNSGSRYGTFIYKYSNLSNFIVDVDMNTTSTHVGILWAAPNLTSPIEGYQWIIRDYADNNRIQKWSTSQSYLCEQGLSNLPSWFNTNEWYHLKLVVKGSLVKGYINDVLTLSCDHGDSSYSTGYVGLTNYDQITEFDNFKITPLISDNNNTDSSAIDTIEPGQASGFNSSTHNLSMWSGDTTLTVNWSTDATDYGDDFFYYLMAFDNEGNENNEYDFTNPGFEKGDNTGWSCTNDAGAVGQVTASDSYKGDYSMNETNLDGTWQACTQIFDVDPNTIYMLSVKFKTNSSKSGYLNFYDTTNSQSHTVTKEGNNEWQVLENIYTTQSNQVGARVYLYAHSGGEGQILYDEVRLEKIENNTIISGLDGYSTTFTSGEQDVTSTAIDVNESVYEKTNSSMTTGTDWYFNIKSADNAGNWDDDTDTAHYGPFWICDNTSGIVDSDADDIGTNINLTDPDNTCGCSAQDIADSDECDSDIDGTADGICISPGTCSATSTTTTLESPLNNWFVNDSIIFECSVTSNANLKNISVYHNYSGSFSQDGTMSITGKSNSSVWNTTGFDSEKTFVWNCYACDVNDACNFASSNRTLTIDLTNPLIEYQGKTPGDNTRRAVTSNYAYVNVSSTDENNNYSTFLDWDNSLVGWWRFENSTADSSSYGNDGSCSGSSCPTLTTGMRGKAYEFDGSDDYVKINDVVVSNPSSLTISAWFKKEGEGDNYECALHQSSDTSIGNSAYWLGVDNSDYLTATIGARTGVGWSAGQTDIQADLGEWYYLLATWNGSVVKVYINGIYNKQYNLGSYSSLATPTRIGASSDGSNYQFNGTVDEVQIYNRTLSEQEIKALYDANADKYYHNFTGLDSGSYTYKAYSVDQAGNLNETEQRNFNVNYKPTSPTLEISSTYGTNLTTENITIDISGSTDADGDNITNITDWRKDGASIAVLNMPFDTNVSTPDSGAVRDYSTYGNNATLGGGTAADMPTWTSEGQVGGAYEFDGNDYIDLPDSIGYSNEVSAFAWFKSKGNPPGDYHIIFGGSELEISVPTSGQIRTGVYTNSRYVSNHGSGLTDGSWHYIGFTFNGTNKHSYIDGQYVGNMDVSGSLTYSFSNRRIGRYGSSSTYYMNGSIDEVHIYNYSLSPEQINSIYEAGLANHHPETIVSNETEKNEEWSVAVTPNDGYDDGDTVLSANLSLYNISIDFAELYPESPTSSDELTLNATCTGSGSLTAYYVFYNNSEKQDSLSGSTGVSNGVETTIETITHDNLYKTDQWYADVWCGSGTVNTTNITTSTRTILNSPPSTVNLSYPENNDSLFTNRTPRFNWTEATDEDNDDITYHLHVSKTESMSDNTINETGIVNNFYIQPSELEFATYYWRVRANDSEEYGSWSEIWNFTLVPSVSLKLNVDSINFGTMQQFEVNDTTNNNPPPLEIENDGNVDANVSIKSTALWSSQSAQLNTSYYQFKADNSTGEDNSFSWENSQTTWADMSDMYKGIIDTLKRDDSSDTAEIDIRVEVYSDEPPSSKTANITFYGEEQG